MFLGEVLTAVGISEIKPGVSHLVKSNAIFVTSHPGSKWARLGLALI